MSFLCFICTLILPFTLGIACSIARSVVYSYRENSLVLGCIFDGEKVLENYSLALGCFLGSMILLLFLFVSYLLGMSLLSFSGYTMIFISMMFLFCIMMSASKSFENWFDKRVNFQAQSILNEAQWHFNKRQYDKVVSHARQILNSPYRVILPEGKAYEETARKLLALTHVPLALAYIAQNRTDDEALLAYEGALRIEPNNVSILRALADEGYRRCSQDYNAAMSSP